MHLHGMISNLEAKQGPSSRLGCGDGVKADAGDVGGGRRGRKGTGRRIEEVIR